MSRKPKSLDEALEYVFVIPPGSWENKTAEVIGDWWAVATSNSSIVAYFGREHDANAFRLYLVNLLLNGENELDRL